jgi:hypothetical protein
MDQILNNLSECYATEESLRLSIQWHRNRQNTLATQEQRETNAEGLANRLRLAEQRGYDLK